MKTYYDPVNIRGGFYLIVLLFINLSMILSFTNPIKLVSKIITVFTSIVILLYLVDLNKMIKINQKGKLNKTKFTNCPEGYEKNLFSFGTNPNKKNKVTSCIRNTTKLPTTESNMPDYYTNKLNELIILNYEGEKNNDPCDGNQLYCFNKKILMDDKCKQINQFTESNRNFLSTQIQNNWDQYSMYCKQ
jgi:hypothetical protein